jgi:hypothetical protein
MNGKINFLLSVILHFSLQDLFISMPPKTQSVWF